MFFHTGDLNTLLNYETAAQRRNVPIMLGVDGIQKLYGSSNNFIPPAFMKLVRDVGIAFCQSASSMKVCKIQNLNYIMHIYLNVLFLNRNC